MGTSTFEVLFKLKGHQRIILVDAVLNTKEEVGTLFRLPAEEITNATKEVSKIFLHGLKWNQALAYSKKILGDDYPEDIQVYLVAISNTKLETGMSQEVSRAGDKVVDYILEDLNLSKRT